jgi:hypothetical protein
MSKREAVSTLPDPVPSSESGRTRVQYMYIGPTILRPVLLSHRSVYVGGIPTAAQKPAAEDKDLAACFVPLAEAGKALRELEGYPGTEAGELSRCYLSVRKRYLEEIKS